MATSTDQIGHFYLNGGIVCRGCGCLVYVSQDALTAHLGACTALQEANRKRLSGEPS